MADTVNIGSAPNDGSGDTLRSAFQKINVALAAAAGAVNFGLRNYGPLASDPAFRLDGSARQPGDEYFNTVTKLARVFDGSNWVTKTAADTAAFAGPGGASLVGYGSGTVEQRLELQPTLKDYQAVGNGSADDSAHVNSAIDDNPSEVFAPAGRYLVPTLDNPIGTRFRGPGLILQAVTGGQRQLNSYTDDGKVGVGKEYLYRLYQRLRVGGQMEVHFFGDSTVAGGYVSDPNLELVPMFRRLGMERGLSSPIAASNHGVSGTSIESLDALSYLSTNNDCFVIKYGINDGLKPDATRLATFASTLRAKLSELRAQTFGTVQRLAIILVGPNSTSDTPQGRDERWYEQLRNVYVQAARDFKCAYFDTYAYLQDSRRASYGGVTVGNGAAGLWMSDDYSDGRAIHPVDHMQAWIWGGLFDWMFGESETSTWATNRVTNAGSAFGVPAAADLPSTYARGISIRRATTGQGWPIDGAVITTKHVDSPTMQMLHGYQPGASRVITRVGNTVSDAWGPWSGVWTTLTLASGWAAYSGTYYAPAASIDSDGYVHLRGLMAGGTATVNAALFTLPAGMRPTLVVISPVALNGGGTGQLRIDPSGAVTVQSAINATYTSLDGVSFGIYA